MEKVWTSENIFLFIYIYSSGSHEYTCNPIKICELNQIYSITSVTYRITDKSRYALANGGFWHQILMQYSLKTIGKEQVIRDSRAVKSSNSFSCSVVNGRSVEYYQASICFAVFSIVHLPVFIHMIEALLDQRNPNRPDNNSICIKNRRNSKRTQKIASPISNHELTPVYNSCTTAHEIIVVAKRLPKVSPSRATEL